MQPTALITGAAGQDGTLLSTFLARNGWHVVAVVKPGTDTTTFQRYVPSADIREVDLESTSSLGELVFATAPDWVANLAGISSITESQKYPELTQRVNVDAVRAILDALIEVAATTSTEPRFFQATSATIFEGVDRIPQNEQMEPSPKTPYARSKYEALQMVAVAREAEGLFAVSGILYNHESPLRGPDFVTRKISRAVARIAAGQQDVLELGDIEVARDWGWAPDYVHAIMLMLNADVPKDYVISTGVSHRLSYFLKKAFEAAGISDWSRYVVSTASNQRPVDTNLLVGDSSAIKKDLGWRSTVDFDSIARIMVEQDMELVRNSDHLWPIVDIDAPASTQR